MSCTLMKNAHYNAPVNYIFGMCVHEFDISKSNISILYDAGKIRGDVYTRLLKAEKSYREWQIGVMQRDDPTVTEVLRDGTMYARERFADQLQLEDAQILHIDNDAIFYVTSWSKGSGVPPEIWVGDHTKFTHRGTYDGYLKLGPMLHVYPCFRNPDSTKVRGIDNVILYKKHRLFLERILDILRDQSLVGSSAAYNACKNAANYIQKVPTEYPDQIEICRRFDQFGMYDISPNLSQWSDFQMEYLGPGGTSYVNPSYNIGLLQLIGNYLMDDMIHHL